MSTILHPNNLVTEVTEPLFRYKSNEFDIMKSVQSGSVFIGPDTVLPRHVNFETRQVGTWHLLDGTSVWDLDRQIRNAGWHFSFFLPSVSAWSVGLNRDAVLWMALLRLLGRLDDTQFNAVEIDQITHQRLLGLYVGRVSAHPRCIRPSRLPNGFIQPSTQSAPWRYPWDL